MNRRFLQLSCTLLGFVIGYAILHPYAMLVYIFTTGGQASSFFQAWSGWSVHASAAFRAVMLPMAVAFALFGAIIGFMLALLIDRKRRLCAAELESEKSRSALEAVKNLMVTLSHYLLNANMIIGGKVRHCRKATTNQDILAALDSMEEQGHKIDAVIGTLRHILEMKTVDYTSDGRVTMLDIAGEVDRELRKWTKEKEAKA
jgi:hypothetical protein